METILRRALRSMAAVGLWRSPAFDPFVPLSVLPPSAIPFTRHPHFGESRFGANLRACTRESRTQPRPNLTRSTASYSRTCKVGSCPTYSSANSLAQATCLLSFPRETGSFLSDSMRVTYSWNLPNIIFLGTNEETLFVHSSRLGQWPR